MTIPLINLGSTTQNANGQTVLNGVSSGMDTTSIINAMVAGQTKQVKTLTDQITTNNSQATALTSLNQLLTQLQKDTKALSQPQSPDSTLNVFASATSQITSNTSLSATNYLTANVAPGTASGTYTISDISSIAKSEIQETGGFTLTDTSGSVVAATPTAGMFSAGTITFASGATVTLTAGESLADVAAAFNAVTSGTNGTGISASIVQTATGSGTNTYKLVFNSTKTGLANAFDFSTTGAGHTVTSDPSGVLSSVTYTVDQPAQDAQFKFNGVTVTRSTNSVSDLVSGVTFNVLQDTTSQAGASFTVSVSADESKVAGAIQSFVNDYNSFLTFYAQQTQIDSTTNAPASTAVLYSDTTLRNIYNQLSAYASSIVSGLSSGSPASLSDVGLNFTDQPASGTTPAIPNILTIDSTKLATAIDTNMSGLEAVFGYVATTSSSNLAVYSEPTDPTMKNFTVNVDQTNGVYTAVYTDSNNVQQTVNLTATTLGSGLSLKAPSGSALSGLVLIYGGTGDQSGITVSATNGIANQMDSLLTSATTVNTGLVALAQKALQTKNTSTQTQITTINTQIDNTKQALLTKFSALEAAIASANSMLSYLNAQQLSNSSGG
ncbi:MAG TPA: flagellar filament capping protein FliD [Rickettsiales bacterium]|nr:flagellar filament capping protein FliD [Rickettsiales bacterium]